MFKVEENQFLKIQKDLIKKYIKTTNNLYDCKKIFSGLSFFKWIVLNSKDNHQYDSYIKQLIKHLDGEIEMYWHEGVIKVKKEQ